MLGMVRCGVALLGLAAANPGLDEAAKTAQDLPRLYSLVVSRGGEIV
jgi:hypothetical protein